MTPIPGFYLTTRGLRIIADRGDGTLVGIDFALTVEQMEEMLGRLQAAVADLKRMKAAECAGEKPRVTKLNGGNARWN